MSNAESLESTIAEVNENGWYIYQLYQDYPFPEWGCTLRALTGPPRREISHGRGESAIIAIYNALGAAPELEAEVSVVDLRGLDDRASPPVDLMKMFVKREPINRRL